MKLIIFIILFVFSTHSYSFSKMNISELCKDVFKAKVIDIKEHQEQSDFNQVSLKVINVDKTISNIKNEQVLKLAILKFGPVEVKLNRDYVFYTHNDLLCDLKALEI